MRLHSFIGNYIRRANNKVGRTFVKQWLRPKGHGDLARLGSQYGGWVVPTSLFSSSSVCYCVGVGEDITFDLALIQQFGCQVFAFDPTPRAIEHVNKNAYDNPAFHFQPVGIWSRDELCKFYAPENPQHVSHSVVNLQSTAEYFEAECKRLSTIMRELGHDRIDLLKLDIEGAEHEVIENLLAEDLRVNVLCAEFDQPSPLSTTIATVRKLQRAGYQVVSIEGWNFTFVSGRNG